MSDRNICTDNRHATCVNYKERKNPYSALILGISAAALVSCVGTLYLFVFQLTKTTTEQEASLSQISSNQSEFRAFMREPRFTERHFINSIVPLQKDVENLVKNQEKMAILFDRIHTDGVDTRIKVTRLESRLSKDN